MLTRKRFQLDAIRQLWITVICVQLTYTIRQPLFFHFPHHPATAVHLAVPVPIIFSYFLNYSFFALRLIQTVNIFHKMY